MKFFDLGNHLKIKTGNSSLVSPQSLLNGTTCKAITSCTG